MSRSTIAPQSSTAQQQADALALLAETAPHHGPDPSDPAKHYLVGVHVDAEVLADVDAPTAAILVATAPSDVDLRPNGWTADGRRVVYTRIDVDTGAVSLHVLDLATGAETVIDAGFAHVSNDGARLLAISPDARPCVASIAGGPCIAIGDGGQSYTGMHAAGAYWAPDDEWVVVRVPDGGGHRGVLLDPTGGTNEQPTWLDSDAGSWQRRAP